MITQQELEAFVSEELVDTDHFLVELDFVPNSKIEIYVDSFDYFTIEDCMELSRAMKKKFGERLDAYDIVVSSAGMDRPFKTMKQYHKNIEKEVKVLLTDGKSVSGLLKQVGEDMIILEEAPKAPKKGMKISKNAVAKLHEVAYSQIKETKSIIIF